MIELYHSASANFSPISGFTGGGSMILTYDYTPSVVALPAPAAAPLLLVALAWLGLKRRG